MDRNLLIWTLTMHKIVALRKESVDRNPENPMIRIDEIPSLSARRAWIEIFIIVTRTPIGCVSLSARRAWIEISSLDDILAGVNEVALRKESVDRNKAFPGFLVGCIDVALRKESVDRNSRMWDKTILPVSLSARRAWIEMVIDFPHEKFAECRSPQGERG